MHIPANGGLKASDIPFYMSDADGGYIFKVVLVFLPGGAYSFELIHLERKIKRFRVLLGQYHLQDKINLP